MTDGMQLDALERIVVKALRNSFNRRESLGDRGYQRIERINPLGDAPLLVDIEAEKACLEVLESEGVPAHVISEEHGDFDLGKNQKYLAILDGLDGSKLYERNQGNARSGTMLALYEGLDPNYEDYLVCGVMEHATKRLFLASKGKGCKVSDGVETPIRCSSAQKLDSSTRIYIDSNWEITRKSFCEKLVGYNWSCMDSSSVHYVDLASGKVDLVLECTRKRNLEFAVAYGLEREAGGVMYATDGTPLKKLKYLEFGQSEYIPVVSAATVSLAVHALDFLNSR